MLENLTAINHNQNTPFKQELFREILKADPEDTFHAPAFKDLITIMLQMLIERK